MKVIYANLQIPHLKANPNTEFNLIVDEDGVVSSELKLLPVPAPKPVLFAKTGVNADYISVDGGCTPLVAIPELYLPLQASTTYHIDVYLPLAALGDVGIPFYIQLHSNDEWMSNMYGQPSGGILAQEDIPQMYTSIQNLETAWNYCSNLTNTVVRSDIRISGWITTGSVVTSPLEVYARNGLNNDGDSIIRFLAGCYIKATPVSVIT
jgi:hypothetical protein